MMHMRMGPGLPFVLSTQVSVLLTGCRQALVLGSTQVLAAPLQVLATPVHELSVLATHASCGRLQVLVVPVHVWLAKTQVCAEGHILYVLLHTVLAGRPEQMPALCNGQSVSTAQLSLVTLHFL
jgi:hypothetical protein